MTFRRLFDLLLALATGLLLAAAWYGAPTPLLYLVALAPLLVAEERAARFGYPARRVFLLATAAFGTWNAACLFWIWNVSEVGGVTAVVVNTFAMSATFFGYHWTRRNSPVDLTPFSLAFWWLAFERLYQNAEIEFPWMTLGNALATTPQYAQWYEYTGALGGSLLAILVSSALARLSFSFADGHSRRRVIALAGVATILPAGATLASLARYHSYQEQGPAAEVVIVQPNIDPFNEKWGGMADRDQMTLFLDLAYGAATPATQLIVGPETAMTEDIWENHIMSHATPQMIAARLGLQPQAGVLLGASTRRAYAPGEQIPATARKFARSDIHYDCYNTALLFDTAGIQIYHKTKLVTGVEKMPYPQTLAFLGRLAMDLGGTFGSLGTDAEPREFAHGKLRVAPVICFESVFGEYVSRFAAKGANLLAVITNDGWWGDTPGYRQHASYARLRAVENRRYVARSANTGISCIINQRGDVLQSTGWWEPATLRGEVRLNDTATFFTRHGDIVGRAATWGAAALLAYMALLAAGKLAVRAARRRR